MKRNSSNFRLFVKYNLLHNTFDLEITLEYITAKEPLSSQPQNQANEIKIYAYFHFIFPGVED